MKFFLILFIIILLFYPIILKHLKLNEIKNNFDKLNEELFKSDMKGYDLINLNEKQEYPIVYAMVGSSNVNMFLNNKEYIYFNNAKKVVDHLLDNKDINKDGIIGYGLPFEVKAGETIYPANHEYRITDMFVINALLDFYDLNHDDKKYLSTSIEIIDTIFKNNCYTSNEAGDYYIWYSCLPEDEMYNASNVNAMASGVLSRLSIYKNDFGKIADKITEYMMKNKVTIENSFVWEYRLDNQYKKYIQDYIHHGYTAYGLLNYYIYRNSISTDKKRILDGFKLYQRNFTRFIEKDLEARSWDLAFNLYVSAKFNKNGYSENIDLLYKELMKYRMNNGTYKFTKKGEENFIRVQAVVLLGLSSYYEYINKLSYFEVYKIEL